MVINPGLGGSCGASLYQLTPPLSPAALGSLALTAARQRQPPNQFVEGGVFIDGGLEILLVEFTVSGLNWSCGCIPSPLFLLLIALLPSILSGLLISLTALLSF